MKEALVKSAAAVGTVTFFGLLADARQDFLRTNAASGLFVVFLLGSGANHVKDLLTQKTA